MDIREASYNDIRELEKLAAETYRNAFEHLFTKDELAKRLEQTRSERYFEAALGKNIVLIAEEDDRTVGYAEFGPTELGIGHKGDKKFFRLYVLASYQRRGIGQALIETALNHPALRTAKNVYLGVWKENEVAKSLYTKYGFEVTGMTDVDGDIIMVRRSNTSRDE